METMFKKDIDKMSSQERIIGYMKEYLKFTEAAYNLRSNGRSDYSWNEDEANLFEKLSEDLDPWWYVLSEKEKDFLKPIETQLSKMARGEPIG